MDISDRPVAHRVSVPIVRLALVAVLLSLIPFAGEAWSAERTWTEVLPNKTTILTGSCQIGAFVGISPPTALAVNEFESLSGRHVHSVVWYQGWDAANQPPFPASDLDAGVRYHDGYDTQTILHLTWEPWADLTQIANGTYDSYLSSYAIDCKDWGDKIRLRFAHEMIQDDIPENGGEWYPWQDQPAAYVAAFRHIHEVFQTAGASNVEFVWCPNNYPFDLPTLQKYYPGSDYVDWLGMDGYNWGEDGNPGWPSWQWFDDIFYNIYHTFVDNPSVFGQKPIVLGEFATAETGIYEQPGQTKEAWITNALERIKSTDYSEIEAFYWLNVDKERDWRINSSTESLTAFRTSLNDPYFTSHPTPRAYLPLVAKRY